MRHTKHPHVLRWSSGSGRLPFTEEITGSNPVRSTTLFYAHAKVEEPVPVQLKAQEPFAAIALKSSQEGTRAPK